MTELRNCPFCGNDVNDDEGCFPCSPKYWEVRCGNPACFAHDSVRSTREEAITAWNTRPREDAGVVEYTTGHCANNNRLGGCQLHNLHCGYPECDRKPVESTQARQPVARPDLNDMDAARLAWVAKNWCSPVGREFAMHVLKRGGTGDLGDIRSFVDEQLKAALAAALGKSNG